MRNRFTSDFDPTRIRCRNSPRTPPLPVPSGDKPQRGTLDDLPRIRDFKGIEGKLDGRGNYTLGITEQIIFPEINIDNISKLTGMNITFVTSANTDEEGYALLKQFGLPFKNK